MLKVLFCFFKQGLEYGVSLFYFSQNWSELWQGSACWIAKVQRNVSLPWSSCLHKKHPASWIKTRNSQNKELRKCFLYKRKRSHRRERTISSALKFRTGCVLWSESILQLCWCNEYHTTLYQVCEVTEVVWYSTTWSGLFSYNSGVC